MVDEEKYWGEKTCDRRHDDDEEEDGADVELCLSNDRKYDYVLRLKLAIIKSNLDIWN